MKSILTITVLIAALLFTGCMNNSGSGKTVAGGLNMNNPLIDPDYYYEVDTWGTNADVWEFTPRSNPNYTCVNVGEQSRALQCFPKPTK